MLRTALTVLSLLALAACASTPPPEQGRQPLPEGVSWYWLGSADLITQRIVEQPERYSLQVKGDKAQVQADCNPGTATLDKTQDGRMWLEKFALGKAMCPPGSLADAFVRALEDTAQSEVRGDVARLQQRQFGSAMFMARNPAARLRLYRCANSEIMAAVRTGPALDLWAGDQLISLKLAPDAATERYVAEGIEWRVRGNEATLLRDGVGILSACRQSR